MTWTIVIIIFIMMVLFIPNGGEPALLDKIRKKIDGREAQRLSIEKKGDKDFIIEMVNRHIHDRNIMLAKYGSSLLLEDEITDIDPFSTYIFHGGCHGCTNPQTESISGCYSCGYYSHTNRTLKNKEDQ